MAKVLVLGTVSDEEAIKTLGILPADAVEIIRDEKIVKDELTGWALMYEISDPAICMIVRNESLQVLVSGAFENQRAVELLELTGENPIIVRGKETVRRKLTKWLISQAQDVSAVVACVKKQEEKKALSQEDNTSRPIRGNRYRDSS